ncbi:6-carboxytetrahydropterin synthase [Agaribacter marinus]|uniref:6-carboxytetrahydropterin synthase n=1 Tax=Agaribacter marinus TaxID=1431249 RepID=A0AA37T152_9ALTE|nr:6-carboxytetrahydropterin synthase [Agaribacter marinus]GLR70343.1 hypothetical protein GCM10007852_12510 [Agaribacter marinus]
MKLFVNDLTIMDFSYLCPERGMVGESWIVDIILDGGLNDESMIQDFGIVKKQLKGIIDEYVDHKLVIPAEYDGTQITHDDELGRVNVEFTYADDKTIHLFCPPEAYAFVYSSIIDRPSVIAYLKDIIATHLPENVQGIDIFLRAEEITSPFYHYTHGLKKHEGNCQRIAHGHRSKIMIYRNDERDFLLEQQWADRWRDIYIGTTEDLITADELDVKQAGISDETHLCFQYEASQGKFELAMPKSACDLIEYDSTVECIAQHVYEVLKHGNPDSIQVRAFEGVGKGAIVAGA